MSAKKHFQLLDLGKRDFCEVYNLQKDLVSQRYKQIIPDTLILTEHYPPVFTIGRSGSRKNILSPEEKLREEGIRVHEIDRGGDITYHGPGQIVGYPIIDLRSQGRDVHLYLRKLEEVIIRLLKVYGLKGKRVKGMTGVWVDQKKIASIGIGISKWITYHGFCFNLNPNQEHFQMINPCGLGKPVTSLKEILNGKLPPEKSIKEKLVHCFAETFKQ